jgi:hypothetical protein
VGVAGNFGSDRSSDAVRETMAHLAGHGGDPKTIASPELSGSVALLPESAVPPVGAPKNKKPALW